MRLADTAAAASTLALFSLPLAGMALSFLLGRRAVPALPLGVAAATLAAAMAAMESVASGGPWRYPVGGWGASLGIEWRVDGISAVLLATTALVAAAVTAYASAGTHPGSAAHRPGFWPLLLALWTALNALFLSGDLFNLYVTLELTSLAGVALITLQGEPDALRAGLRYLLYALFGSMSYLLGVALLYAGFGSLDLRVLTERMEMGPTAAVALALLSGGLFAKAALFPLSGWLVPAHSVAPTPASAMLSGLVVTASAYLLIRLWLGPFESLAAPAARQFIGVLGAAAVLWGSIQALRQARLKRLVAYSTVAQLGYLLLMVPLGSAGLEGGMLLAATHAIAKAAMFLAAGMVLDALGHDRIADLPGVAAQLPVPFFAMALAGLTLMGLPPSGGFVAKWLLLNAAVAAGQWWWTLVLLGGGLLSAGYVFRALGPALRECDQVRVAQPPAVRQWLSMGLASASLLIGLWPGPLLELLAIGEGG